MKFCCLGSWVIHPYDITLGSTRAIFSVVTSWRLLVEHHRMLLASWARSKTSIPDRVLLRCRRCGQWVIQNWITLSCIMGVSRSSRNYWTQRHTQLLLVLCIRCWMPTIWADQLFVVRSCPAEFVFVLRVRDDSNDTGARWYIAMSHHLTIREHRDVVRRIDWVVSTTYTLKDLALCRHRT